MPSVTFRRQGEPITVQVAELDALVTEQLEQRVETVFKDLARILLASIFLPERFLYRGDNVRYILRIFEDADVGGRRPAIFNVILEPLVQLLRRQGKRVALARQQLTHIYDTPFIKTH